MRKLMISLAAAGTALAFATPAAAQYYPQQSYGYGQQHGSYNGYGQNNWGQVRQLQARLNNVERQINWLDRRNVVRDDRADRLRRETRNLERQLRAAARNGLNPYEANTINGRIARLEQQVQYSQANRYGGYGNQHGYNDRDRDGRDDRYENDHGQNHDD
jgi:small-conductance mechanosensitive channel